MSRKNILWLVSWYPNKYDRFDGDFVQRHAKAASLYDDIYVLFVKQDVLQENVEEQRHQTGHLTEHLIYLSKAKGLLSSLQNFRQWQTVYRKKIAEVVSGFKPFVVHVHVPWKAGLTALWAKRKFRIPYLITEHWGIYNNVVEDNIHRWPAGIRWMLQLIYRNASGLITPSRFLANGINRMMNQSSAIIINNTVDCSVFYPAGALPDRFTFLHVSNMVPLKNVEGILEAFKLFLQKTGADAQLIFVGNKDDYYPRMAVNEGLSSVQFKGEVPYNQVADHMRSSHVLVLNSNMENSPCVIGEAFCCGLPVLATAAGGIPELVDAENGILYPSRDVEALAEAMEKMYDGWQSFNRSDVASIAKDKFSYEAVGALHHELYAKQLF